MYLIHEVLNNTFCESNYYHKKKTIISPTFAFIS